MKIATVLLLSAAVAASSAALSDSRAAAAESVSTPASPACAKYLDAPFRKLHSSQTVNLCQNFAGKPMLIVNTASHCGFTPQFKGLEAVHRKYRDRGLVVVGFASDDFNQEDADEAKVADTCFLNYGVTFTMLAPQHVKGADANPVFRELARQTAAPGWNFNKYLVRADGTVAKHFDSNVTPESAEFTQSIEALLK